MFSQSLTACSYPPPAQFWIPSYRVKHCPCPVMILPQLFVVHFNSCSDPQTPLRKPGGRNTPCTHEEIKDSLQLAPYPSGHCPVRLWSGLGLILILITLLYVRNYQHDLQLIKMSWPLLSRNVSDSRLLLWAVHSLKVATSLRPYWIALTSFFLFCQRQTTALQFQILKIRCHCDYDAS